ncbi:MAG: hypothetical protein RDU14_08855 [Melioribacteraceae bacterium]|nr:hypothetical protein [Melioribacteraceae bacterium]
MSLKKKFVKYLFGLTILLMIINVIIEFAVKPDKPENSGLNELTTYQIDSVFIDVLGQYGIESKWISTKPIKVKDEDSIKKQFTVKLPADLPIPLIIRDVNKSIANDITGFVSQEKKIFGNTEIRVYTNELLKLQAILIPDPQTIRERNNLTFIFSDISDLGQSDFNQFLSLSYKLCAAMVPNEATSVQADSLKKYSKEFVVLLNDNLTDKKYKLETRDQKALIRNSIGNIIRDFREAKLFVIDERGKLYNSVIYNYVRDEFKKRNRELVPLSEFILLEAVNENELVSKFKFHSMDGSGSNQKTFLLAYNSFVKIRPELELFKKKGHRILPISQAEIFLTTK